MVEAVEADDTEETQKELNSEPCHMDDTETAPPALPAGVTRAPRMHRWSVAFLCFYGFIVHLRPGEAFITPLLLSAEKNFTREQVTNEISPMLPYSYMAVLVPVFLLTDYLRYKPFLVLQSLSHVSVWLLLLLGTTLLQMQWMEVFYGITMATRIAYSSYIFSLVTPALYQRVAGYSRSAVLLGVFLSSVLGQLCMSFGGVSYATLSTVSLGFVSFGLLLSIFLPWPKRSLFFNREWREEGAAHFELDKMKCSETTGQTDQSPASSWKSSLFVQMLKELRNVVRVPCLRLWSLWMVFSSAGYYLVLLYVHLLWNKVYPAAENKHVYNGGVEAASTLLESVSWLCPGAVTAFSAGFVKIRWNLWSELVIGIITALQAGLLLLMGTTSSIWVCYVSYVLFKGFYQFLVPLANFQIASSLTKELCALVFGVNTFLGTILKSIITIVVADKRGLALSVHSQFSVYFCYFMLLTIIFLGSAAVVLIRHYRTHRRDDLAKDPSCKELAPLEGGDTKSKPMDSGASVKV
ncbi:folate transporter 1-like isoform X1 [Scleropages formosus]|uniref:folate transporter 1-like isoform X1 n=1 Tax=Scleropages formosus TaxID=113540 RepID=UPI00087837F4|nr:folate transporter 1-like isoform X1 [Scleropages formosus]